MTYRRRQLGVSVTHPLGVIHLVEECLLYFIHWRSIVIVSFPRIIFLTNLDANYSHDWFRSHSNSYTHKHQVFYERKWYGNHQGLVLNKSTHYTIRDDFMKTSRRLLLVHFKKTSVIITPTRTCVISGLFFWKRVTLTMTGVQKPHHRERIKLCYKRFQILYAPPHDLPLTPTIYSNYFHQMNSFAFLLKALQSLNHCL